MEEVSGEGRTEVGGWGMGGENRMEGREGGGGGREEGEGMGFQ